MTDGTAALVVSLRLDSHGLKPCCAPACVSLLLALRAFAAASATKHELGFSHAGDLLCDTVPPLSRTRPLLPLIACLVLNHSCLAGSYGGLGKIKTNVRSTGASRFHIGFLGLRLRRAT